MSGTGWTCPSNSCTRSDGLNPGFSYPEITVTVNVPANAPSQVTNQVTVSGGEAPSASATDSTAVASPFWTGVGGVGLGQMADDFLTSPEAFNSDFTVMAV